MCFVQLTDVDKQSQSYNITFYKLSKSIGYNYNVNMKVCFYNL